MYIPLGFAQINFRWGGGALPNKAETTFGVQVNSGQSPFDIWELLVEALSDSGLTASLSSQVGIVSTLVKLGPNNVGASGEFPTPSPGEVNSEPVPPNTSLLVRKVTGAGGRQGSGRWYLPGVPENQVTGAGMVSSLFMEDYRRQTELFRQDLADAGIPMFLLHTSEGGLLPPLEVTSLVVQDRVATQRRRLR